MKKTIALAIGLIISNLAISCQLDSNLSNYVFNYQISDNGVTYDIQTKDKSLITYLDARGVSQPLYVGFRFSDNTKYINNPQEVNFVYNKSMAENKKKIAQLEQFKLENETLFSDMIDGMRLSQIYPYPFNRVTAFGEDFYLLKTEKINGFVPFEWFKKFNSYIPDYKQIKNAKIIFQIKLPQDIYANKCLLFKTKEIEIDFSK